MMKNLMRIFSGKPKEAEQLPPPDLSRIFPEHRDQASGVDTSPALDGEETQTPEETAEASNAAGPEAADFSDWLAGDLDQLRDNFHSLQALPTAPSRIRAMFLSAHNLRGTAEPYGYPVIGRICGSLCRLLEGMEDASDELALINLHVEAASAAARTGGGAAADALAETVCSALEEKVALRAARD